MLPFGAYAPAFPFAPREPLAHNAREPAGGKVRRGMTQGYDWQGRVGRKWADEWRRTDRSFAGLTDRLLGRASARPFDRALDIGCGAGEVSLALARGHPGAEVRGIDLSDDLVAAARERGDQLSNLSFEIADAATWRDDAFCPDLLVSRHGVMFFTDPVAACAHLRAACAIGASLVFSCFRDRAENPWASRMADLLPPGAISAPEPGAPGPFAFADQGRVRSILEAAGWSEVTFEAVDYAYIAGSGADPVDDALSFFLTIGPAAAAAAQLDEADRAAFVERLHQFVCGYADGSIVAMPGAAWLITARNA
jgi:SAM-dependent methyltransferase